MEDYEEFYALTDKVSEGDSKVPMIHKHTILGVYQTSSSSNIQEATDLLYLQKPEMSSFPLNLNKHMEQSLEDWNSEKSRQKNLGVIEKHIMKETKIQKQYEGTIKIYAKVRVLTNIMSAPYQKRFGWTIYATKFGDCIYLCLKDHPTKKPISVVEHYHFKFKQYCFSASPEVHAEDCPINEKTKTYCVHHQSFGDYDLIFSAQIQGVNSTNRVNMRNLDEVNNCQFVKAKLRHIRQKRTWRTKPEALNWWIRNLLTNEKDIYIGYRDTRGFIRWPIECVRTTGLPKGQTWTPKICLEFLHKFLNRVDKAMVRNNDPYSVYEFRFDPYKKCIDYKVHEGKTEHSFLSEPFIEFIQVSK